jgi:phage shock protein C
MNNQRIRMLLTLSVCALVAAVLWAVASGSHFRFAMTNGSTNFDFKIGVETNGLSNLLGAGAVVLFLAALGLHLSGNAGSGSGANSGSPFSTLADIGAGLRRLTKSDKDSWIGGVCGGLGEHTPLPSWVWRIAALVAFFCYGTGFLLYLVLWICLPEPPKPIG